MDVTLKSILPVLLSEGKREAERCTECPDDFHLQDKLLACFHFSLFREVLSGTPLDQLNFNFMFMC